MREHVLLLLDGREAHLTLEEAMAEFPPDRINERAPHSDYTPWRLLEHIRLAQWDLLEYVRNPEHRSPKWPEGYWPPAGQEADQRAWRETIAGIRANLAALSELVRDAGTDLTAALPHAPQHTVLREVLLAAAHTSFHLGEFAALREAMQTWPPDRQR